MFIRHAPNIYCRESVPTGFCNDVCLRSVLVFHERQQNVIRVGKMLDRHRSRFEIIAEILRELHIPTGKTNIMAQCHMSTTQSGDYLDFMRSSDLIWRNVIGGKVMYQTTEVGREFLGLYNKMALLLDPSISTPWWRLARTGNLTQMAR
jgi:predicted transcriptional regulator